MLGRTLDLLFAFPGLLLAIMVVALYGPGLLQCAIALGIAYTPWSARVTRSAALRERVRPYIGAAQVQGLSSWTICRRHLIPNIAPIIIAQATISFGYALVDLAALSFLGFNIQAPTADWGVMINSQDSIIEGHYAVAIYPAVAIRRVLAVSHIWQPDQRDTGRTRAATTPLLSVRGLSAWTWPSRAQCALSARREFRDRDGCSARLGRRVRLGQDDDGARGGAPAAAGRARDG